MNDLAWQRRENRLVDAHRAVDPPLSPELWRGVEMAIVARPPRRALWLAMGVAVLVAAGVAVWFLPSKSSPVASVVAPVVASVQLPVVQPPVAEPVPPAVVAPRAPPAVPAVVLNQVVETRGAVTVVIAATAGRIEIEPCRGRFVNVTALDSPHRRLELVERGRRIEARFDGGPALDGGVVHVLVPADTHLVISTQTGAVVVRGLGGPIEVDTQSGALRLDTAPRLDPVVTAVSDSGAITWQGRCGRGCRVDARSRSGDISLRASDPAAFTRGAARGESTAGHVFLEELTCTDPRCSSSPLPWRQPAGDAGHPAPASR
jgi:hypothetical protein